MFSIGAGSRAGGCARWRPTCTGEEATEEGEDRLGLTASLMHGTRRVDGWVGISVREMVDVWMQVRLRAMVAWLPLLAWEEVSRRRKAPGFADVVEHRGGHVWVLGCWFFWLLMLV